MNKQINIDIQEPPVSKFKKQGSCIKKSCFSGCGCIGIFFFALLILLNILTGSGSKEVKVIPTAFPTDLELYDTERIDSIRVSDAPVQGSIADIASIFPKAILAITYLTLDENSPSNVRGYYDAVPTESESWIKQFWQLMNTPISRETAEIDIIWKNLPAEPKFIQEFYTTNLSSATYTIQSIANTPARREFLFEKDSYTGSVLIVDDTPDIKGTDIVQFTISLPYSSL